MQPQTEFIQTVLETVNGFGLPWTCTVGPVPTGDGLAFQLGPAQVETMYYDRRARRVWPLTFCCKAQDKQDGFDVLCALKNGLETLTPYPGGEQFAWEGVRAGDPEYSGEQDGHLWSCHVDAVVYY